MSSHVPLSVMTRRHEKQQPERLIGVSHPELGSIVCSQMPQRDHRNRGFNWMNSAHTAVTSIANLHVFMTSWCFLVSWSYALKIRLDRRKLEDIEDHLRLPRIL